MKKTALDGFGIKKVVSYLRKSRQDEEREKKTGEDTLHEQKTLMDRVLSSYGVSYDQRPEIGSGDKIATRPVFQKVIDELKEEKYEAIAVKEISRMGRGSYTDMGIIYDLLVEKRIFIITPWKVYDPTNPADLRQIRFELFMSREEFETTRERLTGGRYNAAMEGKWVSGPAPFGFNYNAETKRLVINEEESTIVRTVFDYYANGVILMNGKRKLVQFRALATFLKRIGIKTITGKDDWSPSFLKKFLCNDRYIGIARFNTTQLLANGKKVPRPESEHIIVTGAFPKVINQDIWDKVQFRINNRDTLTNTKLDFEPNRLAGLCVCTRCGKKFIRRGGTRKYKKRDGTVSIYEKHMLFCGTNGCTYVRYNAIEEDILASLKLLQALNTDAIQSKLKELLMDGPVDIKDNLVKRVDIKREELNRRMQFIYDKFEAGIYTDNMFLDRKKEIKKEREELNKINLTTDIHTTKEFLDSEVVIGHLTTIFEVYNATSNKVDKNSLLHSLFSHINIEILKKGSGAKPAVHKIDLFLKCNVLTIQET